MIDGLFQHGSLPSLQRLVQFTSARQGVLSHNIANLSTPHFRPKDLSVKQFQRQLGEAVDRRRATGRPIDGPLELRDSRQVRFDTNRLKVEPEPADENILFHDRNNRDLERLMQDLAENTLAHNAGIELLRSEFDLLKMAIRERV